MSVGNCNTCGQFCVFLDTHKCPPRWLVWCLDYTETEADARTVYGSDAMVAAEKWAERDDAQGDYTIVRGTEVVVMVRQEGSEEPARPFAVHGESVPSYDARPTEACPLCKALSPVPDAVMRIKGARQWVHDYCKRKTEATCSPSK